MCFVKKSLLKTLALLFALMTFEVSTSTAQSISTIAGGYADHGNALSVQMMSTPDAVVDKHGNIYAIDLHCIRMIDPTLGTIKTIVGTGNMGYTGDGGPALLAQLNRPQGLAVDDFGNLFIADHGNNVIRKIVLATGVITTVAGTGANGQITGDDGLAINAEIGIPTDVIVDANGDLYFSEFSFGAIRKITMSTGIITHIANTNATPSQIVLANGNIYTMNQAENTVMKINLSDKTVKIIAGTGTGGYTGDNGPATSAQINGSEGIAVDANEDAYISDGTANRIRKIDHASGIITTIGGNGEHWNTGDSQQATSAGISRPAGLFLFQHQLYISCQADGLVRKIDLTTGLISSLAGNGGYGGDGGSGIHASINNPRGMAIDQSNNVYFSDSKNNRIRKVEISTGIITTVAGTGVAGFLGDGGSALNAEINNPQSVALDHAGNLFFADYGNLRIRKVAASTGIITTVAGTGSYAINLDNVPATSSPLIEATDVGVDNNDNLYILEASYRLAKVDHATGIISTIAGSGPTYSVENVSSMTVLPSGDVYLVDDAHGLLSLYHSSTGTVDQVYNPIGGSYVTVSPAGDLYISKNSTIVKISSGVSTIVAGKSGLGIANDGGDNGNPLNANIYIGILTFDSDGILYFCDTYNNRIRKICFQSPNPPTLTVAPEVSGSVILTSSVAAGNQWYQNGVILDGEVNQTLTVTTSGNYSAITREGKCSSVFSDMAAVTITVPPPVVAGLSEEQGLVMAVYPIPAKNELTIKLSGFQNNTTVDLFIYDMLGRKVGAQTANGNEIIYMSTASLSIGRYIVRATQARSVQSKLFLKD